VTGGTEPEYPPKNREQSRRQQRSHLRQPHGGFFVLPNEAKSGILYLAAYRIFLRTKKRLTGAHRLTTHYKQFIRGKNGPGRVLLSSNGD